MKNATILKFKQSLYHGNGNRYMLVKREAIYKPERRRENRLGKEEYGRRYA